MSKAREKPDPEPMRFVTTSELVEELQQRSRLMVTARIPLHEKCEEMVIHMQGSKDEILDLLRLALDEVGKGG